MTASWTVDRDDHPECMHVTCDDESERLVKLVEGSYRVYCHACLDELDDTYIGDFYPRGDRPGCPLDLVKQSQLTDLVEEDQ